VHKLAFEISRKIAGTLANFINVIEPTVISKLDRTVSISGVFVWRDCPVTQVELSGAAGKVIRADAHLSSPGVGDLYKLVGHAARCRYEFRDVPVSEFIKGAEIFVQIPNGNRISIAKVWVERVVGILTESTRLPTKVSSLRFLQQNGLPLGTVIDIGVQQKTQSLMEIFPDKMHVLVEPIEENYPEIERNYHGIKHQLVRAAASDNDRSGEIEVKTLKPDAGLFTSSLVVEDSTLKGFIPVVGRRKVQEVRLDTLLEQNDWPKPFLLKIDVDGHELRVLQGALETLKHVSCVVLEASIANFVKRAAFLEDAGFVFWDIVDLGYYRGNMFLADIIFVSTEVKQMKAFDPFRQAKLDPTKIKTFLH
jgi:FkbM family methyltransferase